MRLAAAALCCIVFTIFCPYRLDGGQILHISDEIHFNHEIEITMIMFRATAAVVVALCPATVALSLNPSGNTNIRQLHGKGSCIANKRGRDPFRYAVRGIAQHSRHRPIRIRGHEHQVRSGGQHGANRARMAGNGDGGGYRKRGSAAIGI